MKKSIIFIVLFIILFTVCSCKETKDPEEVISVNYNTKIEETLFKIPFDYELSEKDKERGFISVEKKDGDIAVYKIKRKDYEKFISELKSSKEEIFDGYNSEYDSSVKSVSYNDSLTEIVIAVDRTDYENISYDNDSNYLRIVNCTIGCGNNVSLYHSFSTGAFSECEIKIIDNNTGDVLKTFKYPETLLKSDLK